MKSHLFNTCLTLLVCGCVITGSGKKTSYPDGVRVHTVPETTIIVGSKEVINNKWSELTKNKQHESVWGFYLKGKKEIWVTENNIRSANGNIMPNLFILGHEIWHTIEYDFHDKDDLTFSFPVIPE